VEDYNNHYSDIRTKKQSIASTIKALTQVIQIIQTTFIESNRSTECFEILNL
jgi:hypothetical protein